MSLHETAAAILTYALQSGLLLAVGVLAPRLLRLHHPATLLIYWRSLLAAVVLIPLATSIWQPAGTLPVIHIDAAVVEDVIATAVPSGTAMIGWPDLMVPMVVVSFLALARIAAGLVYLRRCRRSARPIRPLPRHVTELQRRFGLRVPFVVSDRLSVPITFGWARPIVMVPPSFASLSVDQQEGVACHELLHVRRRDWPVTFLEEVVRALLWFHPAVWVLLSKTALSREQVVDASTVRITGKRRQYLDALWQIVCTSQSGAARLAVPLFSGSHLRARVEHLKKETVMSRTRIAFSVLVVTVMIAAAGYVGASVFASAAVAGEDTASLASPYSTRNDSPKGDHGRPAGDDEKLKTTQSDLQCTEISHPVAVEKVNPVYPEEARSEKIMGVVIVEVVVTEHGTVEGTRVLESPDERLSEAAVEAVRQWRFEPALCDGTTVGVYYNLTINFRLQ